MRQGCPLSPLLYVLSIEVLAVALRSHPSIVGLRLPGVPTPLLVVSLYADDTSIISLSYAIRHVPYHQHVFAGTILNARSISFFPVHWHVVALTGSSLCFTWLRLWPLPSLFAMFCLTSRLTTFCVSRGFLPTC